MNSAHFTTNGHFSLSNSESKMMDSLALSHLKSFIFRSGNKDLKHVLLILLLSLVRDFRVWGLFFRGLPASVLDCECFRLPYVLFLAPVWLYRILAVMRIPRFFLFWRVSSEAAALTHAYHWTWLGFVTLDSSSPTWLFWTFVSQEQKAIKKKKEVLDGNSSCSSQGCVFIT